MPKSGAIRVLVADDHPVVRDGLIRMIEHVPDLKVVAQAENGLEAVDLFFSSRADVGIIDLQMPELDGVGAITNIRKKNADAKLILFTTYDTDDDIDRGLRAGGKAYLLKDISRDGLAQCIRDVHQGLTCIAPRVASRLADRVAHTQLTMRELECLKLLVDGMANKEIAAALFIAESTVKMHLKSLFEKLIVTSRTEAIKVAYARGILRPK